MFAAKIGYVEQYAQSLSGLVSAIGGKSKVAFEIEKAIALGEIAMRTAVAVVTDNSNPLTVWKVPYDIALGAAQGAVVAAEAIKGFESGGFTGVGDPHDIAGLVHRNEYVVDHATLARAGGPAGVERALQNAGQSGPLIHAPISISLSGTATAADAKVIADTLDARLRSLARDLKEIDYRGIRA
jgi:hypothetical protein